MWWDKELFFFPWFQASGIIDQGVTTVMVTLRWLEVENVLVWMKLWRIELKPLSGWKLCICWNEGYWVQRRRMDLTRFSDILSFIECNGKCIDRKAWKESWIEKDKYCHGYVRLWWDRQQTGLRGRVCKEKN